MNPYQANDKLTLGCILLYDECFMLLLQKDLFTNATPTRKINDPSQVSLF